MKTTDNHNLTTDQNKAKRISIRIDTQVHEGRVALLVGELLANLVVQNLVPIDLWKRREMTG
jgi:hypothetical protein